MEYVMKFAAVEVHCCMNNSKRTDSKPHILVCLIYIRYVLHFLHLLLSLFMSPVLANFKHRFQFGQLW